MKSKITFLMVGLLSGVLAVLLSSNILKQDKVEYQYMELKEDYVIEGVGTLKKGTKVRIEKEMEEGFTRCILYLNHKYGATELYQTDKEALVIPYWINPKK